MRNVYVIATACTPFGKHAELSFQALTRQAWSCWPTPAWTPTAPG
jgi:acetyl-CoA acetyltransferase